MKKPSRIELENDIYSLKRNVEYHRREHSKWKAIGIFFIVLSVILIYVGLFGLKWIPGIVQTDSYKIYLNECHNETIYIPLSCYYDENTSYVDVQACLDRGQRYEKGYRKVCNEVEVNEIKDRWLFWETGDTKRDNYQCSVFFNGSMDECPINMDVIDYDSGKHYHPKNCCYPIISREKLTKEWLGNNCECIYYGNRCKFGYYPFKYKSFGENITYCYTQTMIDCLKKHDGGVCTGQEGSKSPDEFKCLSYKCGDYFVEVTQ